MLKAIWLSDLHLTSAGEVAGHNPRVRITAAIEHIKQHHFDAQFCILSGDLVNHGTAADYQALKTHLDDLKIPCFPMVGNHDDRNLLRSLLSLPKNSMADFIQYAIPTSEGLMICLDTQKTGSDAGEFCEARCLWLQETLESAGAKPVFLFVHHPPMKLGLPAQDSIRMTNGDSFLNLVGAYSNVKHLFIGHVHRHICGTVKGIPFATMHSVLYQAPAPRPDWDWDSFIPAEEAPGYGVLTVRNSDVNLQYTQFCKYELGVHGD